MRYFLPHETTPSKRALAKKVRKAFGDGENLRLGPLPMRELSAVIQASREAA